MNTKITIGLLVVASLSWILSMFISVGEGNKVIHLITVSAFAFSSGTLSGNIVVRRALDAIK